MSTPLPTHHDALPPIAHLLKGWRRTRKVSQLELSLTAGISQRQVSFIESGRARPSRDTVLHLADALEVPLRERNTLLQAAGFSAVYPIRNLDDPLLAAVRDAISLLLERHEPNPALLVDRQTNFLTANRAAHKVFGQYGDLESMRRKCCGNGAPNLLRMSFHPEGLRPHILNWAEVAPVMLMRARQEAVAGGNEGLLKLLDEIMRYPGVAEVCHKTKRNGAAQPTLTLDLKCGDGRLRLFSMFSSFGWPQDLLTDELRVESFFPADAESAKLPCLRKKHWNDSSYRSRRTITPERWRSSMRPTSRCGRTNPRRALAGRPKSNVNTNSWRRLGKSPRIVCGRYSSAASGS
jgi:transcriptional regulator with XRE-family HTH domain